jgi:hypothetical protein
MRRPYYTKYRVLTSYQKTTEIIEANYTTLANNGCLVLTDIDGREVKIYAKHHWLYVEPVKESEKRDG